MSPGQAKRLLELLALDDQAEQAVFARWDPPDDFRESFQPMKRSSITAPRLQDAALRAAVEQHAVMLSVQHYRELGFDVEELGKPYDLRCTRAGEEVHVEVKGTTTDGRAVMLTANEVEHANAGTFRTDLVVVSNISVQLDEDGQIETSGGEMSLWEAWHPEPSALRPIQFEYQVPAPRTSAPLAPVRVKRSELELVVVQTSPDLSQTEAVSVLGKALADAAAARNPEEEWLGLVGESNHWSGLTRWIAMSDSVPAAAVEALQAACEARGLRAEVEQGNGSSFADLLPELRLSSDGIEKLVPQPLAKGGAEWTDGAVTGRVRGYFWEV